MGRKSILWILIEKNEFRNQLCQSSGNSHRVGNFVSISVVRKPSHKSLNPFSPEDPFWGDQEV